MIDLATEKLSLEKADRDIASGEARIRHQIVLIEELRSHGQGMVEAEKFLDLLQQTVTVWREHRDEIIRTIERLEREAR